MKKILVLLLLLVNESSFSQQFSIRHSSSSNGMMISCPVNTITKGNINVILAKEGHRHLAYIHYTEKMKLTKWMYAYGGAGVHVGTRNVINYDRDGYTIFLAGATAIGGIKINITPSLFTSADITPRVDFPFFGGCEMHKHCGQAQVGNINFSIGVNLK